MRKFVLLFVSLLLPLGAWAQNSSSMDAANQAIISTCRAEGGTYISFKDSKCEYNGCAYVGATGNVNFKGDNERVSGGCGLAEYRNKAKAEYKAELDKKIADAKAEAEKKVKDLEEQKKQAERIGKVPGEDSIDVGDLNGDGVVDEKDREEARRRLAQGGKPGTGADGGSADGSGRGGRDGNGNDGRDGNGNGNGNGGRGNNNSSSSRVILGDGEYECEYVKSGKIRKGEACYKECRKNFWGTERYERKKCVECVVANSIENGGRIEVDWSKVPKDKQGKFKGEKAVVLDGVKVRGDLVCYDKNGNRVILASGASVCPSGSGVRGSNGTIILSGGATVGSGSGSGGTIIVGGVGGSTGAGGVQLPDFCDGKSKNREKCANWMMLNMPRYKCSSSNSAEGCLGDSEFSAIMAKYMIDGCVNCSGRGRNRGSTLSGIAEIAGAVLPAAAHFGSSLVTAKAYQRGQEAWANAATAGFEQCRLSQESYLGYLSSNELPGMTPEQRNQMNCNGYSLGAYGGLGGMYGSYIGAGYTPGMIGGMMGPYGMYNPYGMGGYVGGAVGGMMTGGYVSGVAGGMYPGMTGYVAGGYVSGGYASGIASGIAGGIVGGIGIAGGMYPGYAGGMYTSGIQGGMYPGYAGGMYTAGMAGGMYPGYGYTSGMQGGMGIAGGIGIGIGGGMYPGYGTGIGGIGGWGSGVGNYGGMGNYYGAGNNYYASQQAANIDGMLQQQGMMYQMGQMSGGMSGMYGSSAGMYPSNMGMGLNLNIGGGFYGGF